MNEKAKQKLLHPYPLDMLRLAKASQLHCSVLLMDSTVTGQLQEMEMIRQKVYQLEQAQIKMKQE